MDVLKLVDEIEDIVENAGVVPFTKKVMIDSDEILEIVKEIRLKMPVEMQEATRVSQEKQSILADAQKNADSILNNAQSKIEELIEGEGITQLAHERAKETIANAQENAKEIRLGAMEYADNLLLNTQENLKEAIVLLNDNRKELRGDE